MRIRITFAKQGALRYTGNLDLHKLWERSARRADLALAYSQGFHPQPKIQLAAALPLGFSSRCELVDMRITGQVELAALPERLQQAAPPGLKILKVEEIAESSPPLQTQIIAAEYEVTLFDEFDEDRLAQSLAAVLAAETLPRERRDKPYDLRPLIEDLRQIEPDSANRPRIFMRLAARESATGRPEEVLSALGIEYEGTRVERTRFIFRE
ncbi:MAG: TIGR03936 family radical SAM-associated protein [Anaerolineales bacterium]